MNRKATITAYKQQADSKRVDALLEIALLDDVRKGNRDAIGKLVDSWEYVIINVIENEMREQVDKSTVNIEKMFNARRAALVMLAEKEIGSTNREIFFRFGTWCVRQEILRLLN